MVYPNVTVTHIGTRPDCVDDEKLDLLAELARKRYVAVEYGVESTCDETLRAVRRGHDFAAARQAISWNYTPKSNKPWIRTGSLAGTSAIVLKYPDNQCWILITNTSTWKGHGFSNDTMAFFEKLRKKYMANMPKKDLFL